MTSFRVVDEILDSFSTAMSEVYHCEVPLFGALLDFVAQVSEAVAS